MTTNENPARLPAGSKEWFDQLLATDSLAIINITDLMKRTAVDLFSDDVVAEVWQYMFDKETGMSAYRERDNKTRPAPTLITAAQMLAVGTDDPELTYIIGRTVIGQIEIGIEQRQPAAQRHIDTSVIFDAQTAQNHTLQHTLRGMKTRMDTYATEKGLSTERLVLLDKFPSAILTKGPEKGKKMYALRREVNRQRERL